MKLRGFVHLATLLACSIDAAFFGSSGAMGQDSARDSAIEKRFLEEAPLAWEQYSRTAEQLQGKATFNIVVDGQEGKIEHHYELKANGERKLFYMTKERHVKGAKDYHTFWVYAINPNYSFGLTRKSDSSPWVVADLTLDDPEADKGFQKQFEMKPALTHLVRVETRPLTELVGSPTFQVLKSRWV